MNRSPLLGFSSIVSSLNKTLKLLVAGYDGVVCVYEVNTADGGECRQMSQDLLFNMSQNPSNQQTMASNDRRNSAGRLLRKYCRKLISFRLASDVSGRLHSANALRNESKTVPLTNDRHLIDQTYDTATDEGSFPQLPSPPTHGDDE